MKCEVECTRNYLKIGTIPKNLHIIIYVMISYLLLILILENNIISKIIWCITYLCKSEPPSTVPDVTNEFQRVKENWNLNPSDPNSDHLLVQNVKKVYVTCTKALKGVSFGFKKGECFGLLGTNGAGKSTMFKILTHSIGASCGDAKINSNGTSSSRKSKAWRLSFGWPCFLHCIGYCPQNEAINEDFTVYENVKLNVILNGVPYRLWEKEINFWLEVLGLHIYKYKKAGKLSGGNKRKLCVANALIGNKEIIFLDEPTSGVDPASRHSLWALLSEVQNAGLSIVLTSHSMDECEALCQRLVILVQGEMRCIGPIEYLKHNYTQGFTIQMRLAVREEAPTEMTNAALIEKIIQAMNLVFPTVLKDQSPGFLTVIAADGNLALSFLFNETEKIKKTFPRDILDFTITDTSLEDIFISFAKEKKKP